jgi:hypothetical protein
MKALALFTCAMLLAGAAKAQLKPPYLEYAAKFTCGQETAESDDVVRGVYASSINIHNPQAEIAVNFVKKIVVANREDTEIGQIVVGPAPCRYMDPQEPQFVGHARADRRRTRLADTAAVRCPASQADFAAAAGL